MVTNTNIIINGNMVIDDIMVMNDKYIFYIVCNRHIIICCVIFFGDMVALGGRGKNEFYLKVYSRSYNYISISLYGREKLKKKIKNVL